MAARRRISVRAYGGTHLRMVHDGFVFPGNQSAYDAMSPGWGRVLDGVGRVTAES